MSAGSQGAAQTQRRMRGLLIAFLAWLALAVVLIAWWGRLILIQATHIEELERQLGVAEAAERWARTARMLYWESAAFITFFAVSTALLLWLYWRDTRRVKSLQAFFASMTHELRTPLTSIRLQAESIAESLPPGQATLVHRLLEDTMRLESQVDRTLELARVEGGGRLFTQPLRLRTHVERQVAPWLAAYGDRVKVDTRLDDCLVQADVGALQVILRNLLENSLRHAQREPVTIRLGCEQRDGAVVLNYTDDGAGFKGDPELLGRLFEKGPQSTGTGVGLYLVRVLMERMGGRASFETAPDAGFRVALTFPEAFPPGAADE